LEGPNLKATARKLIFENTPKLIIISLIYIVIVSVISELQYRLPGTVTGLDQIVNRLGAGEIPSLNLFISSFRLTGAALALLLYLLTPAIDVGYMSYCLKTSRKQEAGYKDIIDGFSLLGKTLLISVITKVFLFLWALLFLLPAIPAAYRYRQAYYILLDDPGKGVMQCIRESKAMMRGNKLDLFLLDLSFLGWSILNLLVVFMIPSPVAIPIVLIWLMPYMTLSQVLFYERLLRGMIV